MVLAVTENLVFPVMPFWTIMLLSAWSGWAALAYLTGIGAAVLLILRRAIAGKIVFPPPLQFRRCPLLARLNNSLAPH